MTDPSQMGMEGTLSILEKEGLIKRQRNPLASSSLASGSSRAFKANEGGLETESAGGGSQYQGDMRSRGLENTNDSRMDDYDAVPHMMSESGSVSDRAGILPTDSNNSEGPSVGYPDHGRTQLD
mmetsp:Transcript_18399/g.31461  ORF Transcript_18399/g.31461 Transcript_18399/m.31461 type:complete len:124 (+) Transcript_18399:1104-1475(+)